MAIYRGPGGAGDATADATNAASVAEGFADAAATSAAAAANSASGASTAQTAAEAAQAAAEAAQAAAETAETNAETAETNAETAQTAAEAAQTAAEAAQTAAETAQTAAETAETNAETAETNAETAYANTLAIFGDAAAVAAAVTAAETAETNAETAATNAATSASNAATSETNAATSATNAASSFDSFDDRYLGAKSSDPSLDNDGNALLTGALYWNSIGNVMKVYTGSSWITFNAVNNPVDQADIGTEPNEIPLNQYLGSLAYQDVDGVAGPMVVRGGTILSGVAVGNTGSAYTFNLSVANFFFATLNQNSTFTFTSASSSGALGGFILELTNGGAFTITWPAAVDWPGGTAPTLTASGVDQLVFTTKDNGTTWLGFVAGLDIK